MARSRAEEARHPVFPVIEADLQVRSTSAFKLQAACNAEARMRWRNGPSAAMSPVSRSLELSDVRDGDTEAGWRYSLLARPGPSPRAVHSNIGD